MIEIPLWCGKIAEPFPNKAAYYCDFCEKHPPDGTKLRWFSPSVLVCESLWCRVVATDAWERDQSTGYCWVNSRRRADTD